MSGDNGSLNGRRRVVITGLGALTPLGNDVRSTWEALVRGESGAGPITQFDVSDFPVKFACEVTDFVPSDWIDHKQARRMDRFAQLVVAAARQAERDAGLDIAAEADRIGAAIATGIGGLKSYQDCYDTLRDRGPDRVNPFAIPAIIPNMGAGWVSMELGTKGPLASECTACAASNMAIGDGTDAIRLGRADVMFCGGTEAAINKVGIAGFGAMRALSRRNDDPAGASRPFDLKRDGFVMGEAGAVVVLEELEHAKARGARIYGEIVGYGATSDGVDMVAPSGEGAARCMRMALKDVKPRVDYINPHATSTPIGDLKEIEAIREVFGSGDKCPPISATKSLTGHSQGATGVHEAIYSLLMMNNGFICESANIENLDPAFADMPIVRERRDDVTLGCVLSNSFGFGGTNASIAFKRLDA